MKKRVLQLIGSFHQGGSEKQAVSLTRRLALAGRFDIYLAAMNREGVLLEEAASLGLPEIAEYRISSFAKPHFILRAWEMARYLKANRIDLVHTHDFYSNIFGMTAAALAGIRARVASKRETGGMRTPMQQSVEMIAFRRASAVIVNSRAVGDYLAERGLSRSKTRLIYNGLDNNCFEDSTTPNDLRETLGLPLEAPIITLVANLRHEVKNVPMLLRAAKRIAEAGSSAHFVIAGEGGLMESLEKQAVDLGVGQRTHFIGRCTDIRSLLSESYACVLTSTAEGFSNSIIEYMAAGKAVVVTNVGGAGEAVVNGETGLLVPSNDDEALAAALLTLLDDRELAKAMGAAGTIAARAKFSEQAQLTATSDLYSDLLAGRN